MNSGPRAIRRIWCLPPIWATFMASLGSIEKAAAETQEALRLEPNAVNGYGNLAQNYLALNRPDEAKKSN